MKQTAVEWLFEQLCSEKLSWNKDRMGKLFIDLRTSDIFEKAKAMEREQMMQCYKDGYNRVAKILEDAAKQNGLNLNLNL
jgi:hypothetical protein